MDKKEIVLPEQRNYEHALAEAYEIATERLASADIMSVCQNSGALYIEARKAIELRYLGQVYYVTLADGEISAADSGEKLPPREKLLILHYLTTAGGSPTSPKLITFKELPEGLSYFPTFFKRTVKPLVEHFGKEPDRLIDIARRFDGCKADYGNTAVTIKAFPHVPITLVLWRGDAELAPAGNILFDRNITDYLPTEDIIVLSETIIWRLVRALKQG